MEYFVKKESIVRKIWGKSDTILFIFAGAAAEFALNKAVDWLYFTGKLPSDPLGRLFSTVKYARHIVFAPLDQANAAIDMMRNIHTAVEQNRGAAIPDWAYRDVLFMLIYYSIAAHELLEEKLSDAEKEEVYNVFFRVGERMGLSELPQSYRDWLPVREQHLEANLQRSDFTTDLFRQYKKHLGAIRFWLLVESQKRVVPKQVRVMLGFGRFSILAVLVPFYKFSRKIKLDHLARQLLLPEAYKTQISQLNQHPGR